MMLEKLKRRIPDAQDDALLTDLLDEAKTFILAYTGRDELPAELENARIRLAAILYNRMGMEGETSRSEGGVSRTAEALPGDLRRWLNHWRKAATIS